MNHTFLLKFNEIMQAVDADSSHLVLGQCRPEWQTFLEYAGAYFSNRGIDHPVVVEIGTLDNTQEKFYEGLLGAEHIGIEINPIARGNPEIIGDSRSPETIEELKIKLAGRSIDLLFLDGDHNYDCVKFEYENYGPMTKHLIAFHDLICMDKGAGTDVHQLWREIYAAEKKHCLLTFYRHNDSDIWAGHEMGIGLIVKG